MKKFMFVLLSALFLSGCINITEEIFLEKDGSGKYLMTLDMEKMQEMLEMFKTLSPDSTQTKDLNMSAMDSIQNTMGDLASIPGITEYKKEKKGNTYLFSFRFKDVKALNDAMKKRNEKQVDKGDMYSYSPGNFSFNDTTAFGLNDAMNELNKEAGSDSTQAAMEMFKGMMGDMTYTTIYHFPGRVLNYSNKDAKLDTDGKTLRLELNMMDKEKVSTLRNKVTYQK
jgi:hypothetical protein